MLTSRQVAQFRHDGFLILRGLIEPVYIDAWRRSFWDHLGASPHDRASWKEKPYVVDGYRVEPEHAKLNRHPRVQAIIAQLGGGNFVGGEQGAPLVHWPRNGIAWTPTQWAMSTAIRHQVGFRS